MVRNSVVLSIVEPKPLVLRANVPEAMLGHLRPGLVGKATPKAFPRERVGVTVDSVGTIPLAAGTFEAMLRLRGAAPDGLVAGMSCSVRIVPYERENALLLPLDHVHEATTEDAFYVWRKTEGGAERRSVTIGQSSGGSVEVLSGLDEGDTVHKEQP